MNALATMNDGTWGSWRELIAVISRPQHVKRTVTIALVVGTVFFTMNQLSIIASGLATPLVWFKAGLTYLTPLFVSNFGILSATHRRDRARNDT